METNGKEMTFEALIKANKELNDKRRKVFKELREKLVKEIFPLFTQVLQDSDYSHYVLKMDNEPFMGFDLTGDSSNSVYGDDIYALWVYNNGDVREAKMIEGNHEYEYEYKPYETHYEIGEINSDALVEVCERIRTAIEEINKHVALQNRMANKKLND